MTADTADLTDEERRAYDYIAGYIGDHGRAPAIRDVGRHLGKATPENAKGVVKALLKKGLLVRNGPGARAIALAGGRSDLSIPLRGKAYCGIPAGRESVEEDEQRLNLRDLFGRDDLVAYEAEGRSMQDAGILPGAKVVVRELTDPEQLRNGDVVLAMYDRALVLKVFHRRGDAVILKSRNKAVAPIEVPAARRHAFRPLGLFHALLYDKLPAAE